MSRNRTRLPLLCLALALAFSASRPLGALELTADEIDRLACGETVRRPLARAGRDGLYGGTALVMIRADEATVRAALEDLASYPRIFPLFLEARIVGRRDGREVVRMTQGTAVISVVYHLLATRDEPRRMLRFAMIDSLPHDIEDVRGFWRLFPQPDGTTVVAYGVAAHINLSVLGLIDRVGQEIQAHLLDMPAHLRRWLQGPGKGRYG